jgi:hypothetical protein
MTCAPSLPLPVISPWYSPWTAKSGPACRGSVNTPLAFGSWAASERASSAAPRATNHPHSSQRFMTFPSCFPGREWTGRQPDGGPPATPTTV